MRFYDRITNYMFLGTLFLFLSFSNARIENIQDQVYVLASSHSFDFLTWTMNAVEIKFTQSSIDSPRYFNSQKQHEIVTQSLEIIHEIDSINSQIDRIYGNPSIENPEKASETLRKQLSTLNTRWELISPISEAVLEMQVTEILKDEGLTTGGQPIPWVSYHVTPLPQNLIISSRKTIGAEANVVLSPLTVNEASTLENSVDSHLNVSSLVVNIGGLAAYPTMIMRTTALDWLTNTIAHEWTHIYLGQRPLGLNYSTPELRTMNETTASIAGSEIGRLVMERYYPELLSRKSSFNKLVSTTIDDTHPETFDFRSEMHTTRVIADELLAQGKITDAENYMAQRRIIFWENGYYIRKLNQAYFAFYGSYADTPGGAAGEDPVGPAVRKLRSQSASLKDFLDRISAMSSFAELQKAVGD